jgi:hypothetical protein
MGVPPTVDQSVSIVRGNSYVEIVNPDPETEMKIGKEEMEQEQTVYFIVFLHKEERVGMYVAVKAHAWPARGDVIPAVITKGGGSILNAPVVPKV